MNADVAALRQRLDAEAKQFGPEALRPTLEEWEAYFKARDIALTQDNLDAAVVAVAGVMATVAQLVQASEPKDRVTARKETDQRLTHIINGVRISAAALSQLQPEGSP